MKGAFVLGRLLWRPAVLLDLFIASSIAWVLPWLLLVLPTKLRWHGGVNGLEVVEHELPEPAAMQLLLFLLGGCVVGTVASFAWQDLLHCKLAGTLPGVEKHTRRGLCLLAGAGCSLAVLASLSLAPELGPLLAALVALAGLALGIHLWDPHSSLALSLVACAAVVLATAAAEPLARELRELPVLALLALPLFAASLTRATSRPASRRRALLPPHELGASFETYADEPGSPVFGRPRPRPEASWRWGHVQSSLGWLRALRFEAGGEAGWRWALVVGLQLLVLQCLLGLTRFGIVSYPICVVLLAYFSPQDLSRGLPYPCSRAERAHTVWLGSCQQILILLGTSVVADVVLLTHLIATGGRGAVHTVDSVVSLGLPWAALACGVLPLIQGIRLHYLDHGRGPRSSYRFGTTVIASSVLLCGAWALLLHAPRLTGRPWLLLLPLFLGPLAMIVAPFLYRWHLRRWFRRVDLA